MEPVRIIFKGAVRPSAFEEIQSEIRGVLLEEFAAPNGIGETGDDETPSHPDAATGAKSISNALMRS